MRFLHILGFTLLLCGLCVRAEDETTEDSNEEKENNGQEKVEDSPEGDTEAEKQEKTDEITEEKDVLVLHSVNFDRALSENKYLLVEFCKCDFHHMIIVLANRDSDIINAKKHMAMHEGAVRIQNKNKKVSL